MERISVLFVGDAEWAEFRDAHRWLAEHAKLRVAPSLKAALNLLDTCDSDPTLIVLAQRWPGEFPESRIELIRRAAPLSRISELLGAWCEGQPRSGERLVGTLPVYWHQWIARLAPEFAEAAAEGTPIWSLPSTATDEERLLAVSNRPRRRNQGLLAILSRNAETAAALCDAAAGRGFAAAWVRSRAISHLAGIRAAIWEATRGTPEDARELTEWQSALGGVPVIALLDFPRVDDQALFTAAGAAAIVSKPFWLDDVFSQIERL